MKNLAAEGTAGGFARHVPSGEVAPLYDVAMRYADDGTPLVIVGGKEYGTGSSRDWAAKGTRLLGIKAVIVESFERIHRSNLIGMGVLPLQFPAAVTRETLGMTGDEVINLTGLSDGVTPAMKIKAEINFADGRVEHIDLLARIDTDGEAAYFKMGASCNMCCGNSPLNIRPHCLSSKKGPLVGSGKGLFSLVFSCGQFHAGGVWGSS